MSSGGGTGGTGYYRFPCTYRYEVNCPEWVWQQGDACGICLSEGRPSRRDNTEDIRKQIKMSGEGGTGGASYYRFPCIYRYEYNCSNWVWQQGDACGRCPPGGPPSRRSNMEDIDFGLDVGIAVLGKGRTCSFANGPAI